MQLRMCVLGGYPSQSVGYQEPVNGVAGEKNERRRFDAGSKRARGETFQDGVEPRYSQFEASAREKMISARNGRGTAAAK